MELVILLQELLLLGHLQVYQMIIMELIIKLQGGLQLLLVEHLTIFQLGLNLNNI
jgi:hypothetical protein